MGIYYISLTCATERMRTGYQDVDEVVEPLSVRQQKNGGWQPSHLHGEIILWSITNTLFSAYLSFTAKLIYLLVPGSPTGERRGHLDWTVYVVVLQTGLSTLAKTVVNFQHHQQKY